VSLSPDERRFAFVSVPQGGQEADRGLYVAGFGKGEVRKLLSVAQPSPHDGFFTQTTVDWFPDGKTLVFNNGSVVLLVDPFTAKSRKIADGSAPLWSPLGDWISYVTPGRDAALLNVSSGESKRIDPGKKTNTPLEWSPDGKYLLILEVEARMSRMGVSGYIGLPTAHLFRYRITAKEVREHTGFSFERILNTPARYS
jgi:Tol biopolymer transport system component